MSLVEEFRKWVKTRPKVLGELKVGTYRQLGGGRIVENVGKTVQELLTTVQEKRPKIIPTVIERVKTYEPGKALKTFVPTKTEVLEKPETPQPETSILRRPK